MANLSLTFLDYSRWIYGIVLPESGLALGLSVLLVLLTAGALSWYWCGPSGIPPGPRGVPLFGYLPFLGKVPHETLASLARKHNSSVFSMYLGRQLVIVLNDYRAVKAAFVDQAENFAGRPAMFNMSIKSNDNQGLSANEGSFWKNHRNLVLTALKSQSIEDRVMQEITRFVATLKSQRGIIDLRALIETSVMTNICTFALGQQLEYEDPTFVRIRLAAKRLIEATSSVAPATFLPWTRYVPGVAGVSQNRGKLLAQLYDDLKKQMDEKKCGDLSERGGNYVDAYRTKQEENPENEDFSETALLHNTRMLMTAGTEPTSNALEWCLLHLMVRPDVQHKVQEEIERVIGSDRCPAWSDLPRTPYTEATICEVLRMASLMPISLLHSNKEECKLLGYKIPKRSYIMANFWNVHHDPTFWPEPHTLRPERFLGLDCDTVVKPSNFIPFSTGKRQCVGEQLGRMELYLYFTTLLQNFTFKSPDDSVPSLEPIIGLHLVPKKLEARIVQRI